MCFCTGRPLPYTPHWLISLPMLGARLRRALALEYRTCLARLQMETATTNRTRNRLRAWEITFSSIAGFLFACCQPRSRELKILRRLPHFATLNAAEPYSSPWRFRFLLPDKLLLGVIFMHRAAFIISSLSHKACYHINTRAS